MDDRMWIIALILAAALSLVVKVFWMSDDLDIIDDIDEAIAAEDRSKFVGGGAS